jgi:hypothetical protein
MISYSEIILTLIVALIVLKPTQWLTLIEKTACIFSNLINHLAPLQTQLQQLLQQKNLIHNLKKAKSADNYYQQSQDTGSVKHQNNRNGPD